MITWLVIWLGFAVLFAAAGYELRKQTERKPVRIEGDGYVGRHL